MQGRLGIRAALSHTDPMSFGPLSHPVRRNPRRAGVLGVVLALSLSLSACGGDDKKATDDEPTNTAGTIQLNGQWPLTGEKLEGDLPDHPVYVVKIDNTSSSAPQIGLGSADMIVEELVEGGLTRLAVFFYSDVPDNVGPVRSIRASDIGIVKAVHAVMVASGGAPVTARLLGQAGVKTMTEGAEGFYREDSRSAPYNLMMHLDKAKADKWKPPTDTYLPFGDESDFTGTQPVRKMSVSFSGGHTTDWEYTDKGWVRPDSNADPKDDFLADSVLILRVRVGDAGYKDPAGNPVPETKFVGRGKATLIHGGKAVNCTWIKRFKGAAIKLVGPGGDEIKVPAGHTWIELVPAATGKVTLSK